MLISNSPSPAHTESLRSLCEEMAALRSILEPKVLDRALIMAMHAWENAYRPYVSESPCCGVSIVSGSGEVFSGAPFQNAAYPSSFSEVRVALAGMIARGEREVRAIVVYGDRPGLRGTGVELVGEFAPRCLLVNADRCGNIDWNIMKFPDGYRRGACNGFAAFHRPIVREVFGDDAITAQRPHVLSPDRLKPLIGAGLDSVYALLPEHTRQTISLEKFIVAAETACITSAHAYAPYSKYPVGAAAVFQSGEVYGGCNYENQNLELGSCAERTALSRAMVQGEFSLEEASFVERLRLLITYVPQHAAAEPCGGCRQMALEAGVDFPVIALSRGNGFTYCESFAAGRVMRFHKEAGALVEQDISRGGFVPAYFGRKHLL